MAQYVRTDVNHTEHHAYADAALRASEEKYRQIFDSIDVGFCVIEMLFDPDGRPVDHVHLEANAAYARLTGLENVVGKRAREVMPGVEPHWLELFAGVLRTGEPGRLEQYAATLDRWFDVHASRIGDGTSRRVAVVFTNTTDHKRHEANMTFLNDVTEELAGLTNIDDTLNTLGARIGAHFRAAVCVFSHVDEASGLMRADHEWHREDVPSLKGVYRTEEYHSDEFRRRSRAGETYVVRNTSDDPRVNAANHAAVCVGALINVPLVRDGEWRFNLGLTDTAPHDWRDDEVELLRELTTRIWNRLERARAELALRDALTRLEVVVAAVDAGIADYDVVTSRNEFDARACSLLGLTSGISKDEVMARSFRPEDRARTQQAIERALAGADGGRFSVTWQTQGGKWLEYFGKVCGAQGTERIVGALFDVTDREVAQASLREAQQRLARELADAETLQRMSSELIPEQGRDQLYARLVDAAMALMRAESASVQVLAPDTELQLIANKNFHPLSVAHWQRVQVGPTSACGQAVALNQRIIVPDIETSTVIPPADVLEYRRSGVRALQSTPICGRDGRLLGVLSTHWRTPHDPSLRDFDRLDVLARQAADVIERGRAEEALRDADRQKDAFIATLSHELRNPVAAIMSAGTLLADPSTTADQRALAAGVVVRQSKTASRLLDDLLDHSRIALGRFELDKQPSVSVRSIVDAALETTQRLVDAANLTVTVTVTPRSLAVDADPGRLSQVVANLVANASHYSEPNQSITIHASVVAGSVEITVRDEGAGIPPAEIGQMFEMFRQGSDESKRARSGMGIGLALARRIVELHGGSINAHSEGLGRGSTFRVVLPGAATAPAAREEPTISNSPRPGRILVIDDDDDLLAPFTAILRALGYDAHAARGGVTGLAEAERLRPDLILLDIGMPGLDGFEVAARIRSTAWGAAITLIALTGWGQEKDKARARAAGFDDHVTKPFYFDQIRPKVDALLARSRATSA